MYIVRKNIHGKEYYYLAASFRKEGRVKTKTIAYLGKTRKVAEEKKKELEKERKKEAEKPEKRVEGKEKKRIVITNIDDLATFCKRKGFVYPTAEIYGGLAGFWDFGVFGAELKNNIKKEWKDFFVQEREDIVNIDGSIITHPKVWQTSGHVESFKDVSVICKKCKKPNKIEHRELGKAVCEFCGGELDKESAKSLNLMFTTQIGPLEKTSVKSYLRPETAQLIFTNFKQVVENQRLKLPFGIAQIGKAFRNEIAPRDFLFRTREFEQMEIEYFIMPKENCPYKIPDIKVFVYSTEMQEKKKEAEEMKISEALKRKIIKRDWHAYWLSNCLLWFRRLGCNMKNFRIRQHPKEELAHYSTDCWDIEYRFPFGWKELLGIADRADYDLSRHEKFSGKDLKMFIEGKGKILPHVVAEPSFGVERAFLVFMLEAYEYDNKRQNIVLRLDPKLVPIKAAILPIVKKPGFVKIARKIYDELKKEFNVFYDSGGSIGRRYARQDEAGTPVCIAIDGQTLKDSTVTLRDRDSTEQIRIKIENLKEIIGRVIKGESLLKLGRIVKTRVK